LKDSTAFEADLGDFPSECDETSASRSRKFLDAFARKFF